jgi:FAD:protein FMN transferase
MKHCPLFGLAGIGALAVLVTIGQWQIAVQQNNSLVTVIHHPRGVMGTDCALAVVVSHNQTELAKAVLDDAEAVLRRLEAAMSRWQDDSEIARFRQASVGEEVPLSRETLKVLFAARDAFEDTDQTFDVTCFPQLELWRRASERGEPPTAEELAEARAASCWSGIRLTSTGIVKKLPDASLDLGGIAKGYAIDRAIQLLRQAGFQGGLVDIGGDLACFGTQPGRHPWFVDVKDPDMPGALVRLRITDRAVATSGDYARRIQVGDVNYSHIIDPRIGYPADASRSVTVVAPTTVMADVWATALSVLGPDGFDRLPEGVEALMVISGEPDRRFFCTPGFRDLLTSPKPAGWECSNHVSVTASRDG